MDEQLFYAARDFIERNQLLSFVLALLFSLVVVLLISRFMRRKNLQPNSIKAALSAIGLIGFVALLLDVLYEGLGVQLDMLVSEGVTAIQSPFLNKLMLVFTELSGVLPSTIVTVGLIAYLGFSNRRRQAVFFMLAIVGNTILFKVLKDFVGRERPALRLIEVPEYAFPSGHATISATVALAVYYIFRSTTSSPKLLATLCLTYAILISFSRVYLNVHYLTDVCAGMCLGLFWVNLLALFTKK